MSSTVQGAPGPRAWGCHANGCTRGRASRAALVFERLHAADPQPRRCHTQGFPLLAAAPTILQAPCTRRQGAVRVGAPGRPLPGTNLRRKAFLGPAFGLKAGPVVHASVKTIAWGQFASSSPRQPCSRQVEAFESSVGCVGPTPPYRFRADIHVSCEYGARQQTG